MNENLNTQQFPEDPLSDEELAMLRDVLNTAFPAPKTSVRDGVMAQIRRELLQNEVRNLVEAMQQMGVTKEEAMQMMETLWEGRNIE